MHKRISKFFVLILILAIALPVQAASIRQVDDIVSFSVLHTNDFHGNLELAGSNPGAARVAAVINTIRTAKGAENVLLFDAGDIMQGSLLSNLQYGLPTIDYYKTIGYDAATFGNHEFDWGQTVLADRVTQAADSTNPLKKAVPFMTANITVKDGADCASSGWTLPSFISQAYKVYNMGPAGSPVRVGVIGVSSVETPYITIASATAGLCFKDPAESIQHYYAALDAASDVIVVLSHNGLEDGGYGYGITVYGDKTLADKLNTAGTPVNLIIGGHSHTNMSAAAMVGNTMIVQAYYAGRQVGQVDFTVNRTAGTVGMVWTKNAVSTSGTEDPTIQALVAAYASDPAYVALINQPIFYTNVPLVRDYNGDNLMGKMVNDAVYNDLNNDATPDNDVEIVFNNPGGLRADIACAAPPCLITYGQTFSVLPFGNATAVGSMTGARIMELLNQSATLFKGAIQVSGIRFKFYRYLTGGVTWAWGAYDVTVYDKDSDTWLPLDPSKTYRVATNEFLAPAGQDGFLAFKYMTGITYWGDMLNQVNHWMSLTYGDIAAPYAETVDGRITREGDDLTGPVVPVTILHHNDSHGNLLKGAYVGYDQLVTLIKQERAYNPTRTLLVSAGDNIQGDAMMYFFKSAALGYSADGTALAPELQINPLIKAFNAVGYDAMTLGNHEFNFGSEIFTSTLKQAEFPILGANLYDDGSYGLAYVGVLPYTIRSVGAEGIQVAILGITNHRVPNYELPSNIPGLSFTDPILMAKYYSPVLQRYYDAVVALTHIGFTQNPGSVEVDNNVDTYLAEQVSGVDAIIGSHSHTDPSKKNSNGASGDYQYLPAFVGGPNETPVLVTQAYRYNSYLGEVILGFLPDGSGGWELVTRAGKYLAVTSSTPEDTDVKNLLTPYASLLTAYNDTVLGDTAVQIDAIDAYTEETNGANLQADASVWELRDHGLTVDFHLSGAMSNRKAPADGMTYPYTLKVADMFTLMPYENSLVILNMTGVQIKNVLERGYRNYFYYKYVPGYGGYSYYTTCMLGTNKDSQIVYRDTNPALPDGNNVLAMRYKDALGETQTVDFTDDTTMYKVSTVNYLAAGSCNFNDGGVSLWPLNQIANDTQYYVRDAVIHYIQDAGTTKPINPMIEGRLGLAVPRGWMPLMSK
ncbi:MAG TPA: 5'-nucleotidase C-terminal domain-containing protein [Anaerolinea sp.]|nr:5'-nucleotidase C-terminal domain-containing protein [Anaerolinea sp.]